MAESLARKFAGLQADTDELFTVAPVQKTATTRGETSRAAKTVGTAACPECMHRKMGVQRQGAHLVWRQHTYTTYSGAPLTCRASGILLCTAPPRAGMSDSPNPVAGCSCPAATR